MNFYNEESEALLLCSLMIDQQSVERLSSKLSAEDFTKVLHQKIYQDIARLSRLGAQCDSKAICNEFLRRGEARSISDILSITGMTYTSANVDHYFTEVKDLSLRRATRAEIVNSANELKRHDRKGLEIAGELERRLMEITAGVCSSDYKHSHDTMIPLLDEIQDNLRNPGKIRGFYSPWNGLNEITGFKDGELILIGARPSVGKTAFMMDLVEGLSVRDKIPSGVFSVEMSALSLQKRMLCKRTGFTTWGLDKGMYRSKHDLDKIMVGLSELSESPYYIDETSRIKVNEWITKARRMVGVNKCRALFTDYVSLLDVEKPRMPRHEQIGEIVNTGKALAKELNIPFIVLCQLRRDSEGKRPQLNDLKESGDLEQGADVVIFLHRDREDKKDRIPTEVIVAKNRNGPIGTCELDFVPHLTKFVNAERT